MLNASLRAGVVAGLRGCAWAGVFAALLGAAALLAEAQADLTGSWRVTFTPPSGERHVTWDLVQAADGSLSGEIGQFDGAEPAQDGRVEGDAFSFKVTRTANGQTFEIAYTGTVEGDRLEGSIDVSNGLFTTDFTGVRVERPNYD